MPRLACAPQRQPPFKQLIEAPGVRRANTMQKKPQKPQKPHIVHVRDRRGDELVTFPAERNLLTGRQREVPNPAAALANLGQPSERARIRAATVQHDQREARARREAHQIIAAADRPAPTVHDDLQAAKRRAWDAPMATREPHAVDRTTLLLARVLAWAGGLVLIGAGIMLSTWLAVGRL